MGKTWKREKNYGWDDDGYEGGSTRRTARKRNGVPIRGRNDHSKRNTGNKGEAKPVKPEVEDTDDSTKQDESTE